MPIVGTPAYAKGGLKKAFGDRAKVGEKGERFTADQLSKLYSGDQSVWVFHDLSLPGWEKANLDHVVVRGDQAVLIDSKCWAPGRYWSKGTHIFRGIKRFESAEKINLAKMSTELGLHIGLHVNPLVIIWPSRPGSIVANIPLFSMRLPDGAPYAAGRKLPSVLGRLLGKGDAIRNEHAMEVLTHLTRDKRG